MRSKDIKTEDNDVTRLIPKSITTHPHDSSNGKLSKSKESIELELKEMIHSVTWLEVDEIEKDINLFSLGFDSLVLVTFNKKISSKYNLSISLNEFFTNLDTVEKIAEYIYENIDHLIIEDDIAVNKTNSSYIEIEQKNGNNSEITKQTLLKENLKNSSFDNIDSIHQIFNNQMQILSEQLEIIKGFNYSNIIEKNSLSRNIPIVNDMKHIKVDKKEDKYLGNNSSYYVPYEDIEKIVSAKKLTTEEMMQAGYFGEREGSFKSKQEVAVDDLKQSIFPMSLIQQRIYTQSVISDQDPYNIISVLKLNGEIDCVKLESAINEIIGRHESLRTRLYVEGGQLKQEVLSSVNFNIVKIKKEDSKDLNELVEESITNFNLEEAPLFKVTLINTGDNEGVLIFNFHHTIADGISMDIFVQELIKLYSNEDLLPMSKQYRDFIEIEKNYLDSDEIKASEKYWLNKLSGDLNVLSLPTDYPIESKVSFTANTVKINVGNDIVSGLKVMARRNKCSLYMVLVATFNILLKKLSGNDDILIGTPVTNRGAGSFDDSIGMFTNTMLLRNNISDEKVFEAFLSEVRQNCSEAYSHMYYPFNFLVDNINKDKNNVDSLTNVMFVYENVDKRVFSLDGLEISPYEYKAKVSEFDFMMEILEESGSFNINLTYKTSLFKDDTITRWGEYYKNILSFILNNNDDDFKIKDIEIIGEAEACKIMREFNNTTSEYPKNKTIAQLFEEQVEKTPNNIAVVYGDKKITYKELNEKSNGLAKTLQEKGVGKDVIVGIMANRSAEMMIGIIAILKAGGAYLPLDPDYPEDRIKYMISNSQINLVLTDGESGKDVLGDVDVLNISNIKSYSDNISNLETTNDSKSLAYVIYTSGTTGKPKGTMVEHNGVISLKNWFEKELGIGENEKILQFASIAFDVFSWELFMAVLLGNTLFIPSKETIMDPDLLNTYIKNNDISTVTLPPFIANNLDPDNGLRRVITAGSEVKTEQVSHLLEKVEVINAYGPTEDTICTTYYKVQSRNVSKIPIGKPLKNHRILILNNNNKLVPIGVEGEICISGEGLARGYLNNEELTKEKFIDNPYELDKKMYKTGDLAKWLPDGNIEFLGRIDNQVKIRGFRIELGEIENSLLKIEGIKEAVVLDREDKQRNKYLCSYLVCDREMTIPELRGYLSRKLPEYMIPVYFIQIENMPLTPNGKIDRKALPEPEGEVNTGVEYAAPRNELEEKLVKIWSKILEIDRIGIDDDFFALGGHSLNATLLLGRIHKELNVEVPLKEIFSIRNIRGLSEYIVSINKNEYEEIKKVEEKEYYETSSAQKRMYMLKQIDKNSVSYNMPAVVEILGELEVEKMNKVFLSLINRHETLRTSFYAKEDNIIQKVHKVEEIQFEIETVQVNSEDEVKQKFQDFIKPFNFEKAPLLRVVVISLEKERHFMLFDMHHIVSDGISLAILTKEFSELYVGKELAELKIQYKDYSEWQLKKNESEVLKKQAEYWLNEFGGEIPLLNLPTDYARPKVKDFIGDNINFVLNREITERLRVIAEETGSTMYMLLLANINILLSKYSGEKDIVIGTPIAGRNHIDLEAMIGMFVNTLAIKNTVNSELSFKEYLKCIKEKALKAYENQDYQFNELVDAVYANRDLSRNPIFDVMFVLQNMEEANIEVENLAFRPDYSYNNVEKFDITISAVERNDEIIFDLSYATSLYKKETIERMIAHFLNIVKKIVADIEVKLKDIEILETEEKNKLLYEFNNTMSDYPKNKTIAQLFEEQVEKTPNNIALVYKNESITYKELNEKANSVARELVRSKVKLNDVVGLIVDKSINMIVGIIAILKVGAAYLPIDYKYNENRIDFMLDDAKVNVVLGEDELLNKVNLKRKTIVLNDNEIYTNEKTNLNIDFSSDSLAYIIYTSGSTGIPKGTLIKQYSVIRVVKDTNYIEINSKDSILQLSSYLFDGSVFDIYGTLLNGARLIIPDEEEILDLRKLGNLIKEEISVFFVTTALFNSLVDLNIDCLKKVRKVLFGGERVSLSHAKKALKDLGKDKIIHVYGPTESTVYVTYYPLNEINEEDTTVPIGKPISNTKLYILGQNNEINPIGVPGELCIGGDGLAIGYLNNESLTREKFIDNPYELGKKMYKTGDLARWLPGGNIEFLGRIDNQVKIRGFRIELGEIENSLLKIEGIKEAVVIDREEQESKYLCAYYVSEKEYSIGEIRDKLKMQIPSYMIPAYFIKIKEMPLTQNGKVDKRKLSIPDGQIDTGVEYEEPRNEMEKTIAETWERVLGIKRVGINDGFFDLGGDSIKAIQVIAKMNSKGYSFELKDLFANPTIKELISHIKQATITIDQSEVNGEIELTPIQKWFFEQECLLKDHFNQELMLFSEVGFEKELVEATFNKIIKHHDVLRAVYVDGKVVNKGISNKLYDMNIYDLRGKDTDVYYITNICTSIQSSMNLEKGPLVKLGLFKTDEGDHLLVAIHHLVVDTVSWRIILEDFNSLYYGLKDGKDIELPSKTTSLKEWAAKQKEYTSSYKLKNEINYWSKLGNEKIKKLFKDFEPKTLSLNTVKSKTITLNSEDTKKLLTKVNRAYSTEINDILLSALALSIGNFNDSDKILLNLESHGREEIIDNVDITRTVGWFTSQFPVILENKDTISELIKNTKDVLRRIPNKGIGYGILKYLSDYEINDINKPEISFNYLGRIDEDISGENFKLSEISPGESISKGSERYYPVDIVGIVMNKKLKLNLTYNNEEYKDETIEALLQSYKENIKKIINHCVSKERVEITASDITSEDISLGDLKPYSSELENIKRIYQLTPMQEGLLYHSEIGSGEAYHVTMEIKITGELNVDILNKSFNELVSRYDILRTNFDSTSFNENMQIVYKTRKVGLEYKDIRNIDSDKEEYITNLIKEDRQKRFDLSKDMLMRLFIVKLDEKEYSLILSNHHIILDGWSFGIISGELFNIYNNIMLNHQEEVKKEVPYEEYIKWLKSKDKTEALSYWSEYLDGYNNNIKIPFKKEKISKGKPQEVILKIDKTRTKLIESVAKNNNVTMNTILQSIWAIQLQRYNNVDDVVFGFIVSGRTTEINGIDEMIGLFINTVPLRVNTRDEKNYSKIIKKMQLDFNENERYRYSSIAEIQNLTDVKARLINTLMVFENYPIDKDMINKSILEKANIKIGEPKSYEETNYSFNLKVLPGEEMLIIFDYNDGEYTEEAVNKIKCHFENILNQIIQNSNMLIDEIEIVDEAEKEQILVDFNSTGMEFERDTTMQELFEYHVSNNPQKTAVLFDEKTMRYKELNMKANSLAAVLKDKGVGSKSIVPIMVDRSFEMVIGILAILKAGAAYLPIDIEYPDERVNYILKDSNAELLLTTSEIREQKLLEVKEILNLENEELYTNIIEKIENANNKNDLAYVIYTSGTTGKPKGTMIEHNGAINLKNWFEKELGIGKDEKILQFASIAFDAFSWELVMSLLLGNTLCIPSKDTIMDPDLLNTYIKSNNISTVTLPPFIANNLDADSGLRRVITAGSEVKTEQVSHLLEKVEVINAYGPTEDTICTTYYKVRNENAGRIPIGKPIKNHRILILDNNNKLVPVGVEGEICILGEGLARGYLNNEELTNKKFIESPYSKGDRLYKTGDVGRWLPNGDVEYLGRIDHQVKIRGFRIEIGEIEESMLKMPNISEVVIIDREKDGIKYLCAYYVSEDEIGVNMLRETLMKSLPKYMIPAYFIRLDKLILNTNGKVDRKALPEPDKKMNTGMEYVEPRNEIEKKVANVWSEVLGVEKISIYDNFFELGGDSIKAIRVISKLVLNYRVSANDIFENQTIIELSKKLKKDSIIEKIKELNKAENEIAAHLYSESERLMQQQLMEDIEGYNKKNKVYNKINLSEIRSYRKVMICGATGYLGIHVLKDLLENTTSDVILLLRGSDVESSIDRITKKFEFYFNKNLYYIYSKRIIVINGDISECRLGLSEEIYNSISIDVDCIINCAANVKHYGKYEELYVANVAGTKNLLNFALKGNVKDYNHVSTISVASGSVDNRRSVYFSEYDYDFGQQSDNYYVQTKQEAEKIVLDARKKGIRCNIIRVGNLVFNSENGKFQENINDNNFYKIMKSYISISAFPIINAKTLEFSFINYVSKALVLLFNRAGLENETYHIFNNNYISINDFGELVKEFNPNIRHLSNAEFISFLGEKNDSNTDIDYVENLLFQYSVSLNGNNTHFVTSGEKTNLILKQLGFEWPVLDRSHVERMIKHCKSVNYF